MERHRQARLAARPDPAAAGRAAAGLPIAEHADEIVAAIEAHPVLVVAGETGSGKSTQLPRLCLEAGRGVEGMIGHTQPRRLAARSIAQRVADELGVSLGEAVGYSVRFTDQVSPATSIKVMTDGILLAEIQRDRDLRRYDTLIIDEAHERSLNIDFLLGYLTRLVRRRNDLRVIITSATIDTERFAEHFDAPVIEVSGRTYPVEVRYRPLEDHQGDQPAAIVGAVSEILSERSGDVLVFCSGEREIHDAVGTLRQRLDDRIEVLPLYARLPAAEQQRIFAPHRGQRVVVATNVAETSLTVPGIHGVVDTGTARISRYHRRLKVQRLPIEPISQASADQRAGRCGRIAPGTCIRLYSEDDYAGRDPFTEPEILRTNLAAVILRMASIGLGEIADFPFIEPPDRRAVADGIRLLEELGALDPGEGPLDRRLTARGRRLARLPIDPRLGRMVLEGAERDCLSEVIVIAAGLSIQDPRERPPDDRARADELHRRFTEDGSDLLAWLRLWEYLRDQQRALSGNAFRRLCREEHLHYLRIREWQDLARQLRQVAADAGIGRGRRRLAVGDELAAHADDIHRALLSGLLSHIGMLEPEERAAKRPRRRSGPTYRGPRDARFELASPTSAGRPGWVMVAELVETDRLRGRSAAPIRPEWAEELGQHLIRRSYSDPEWDPSQARAVTRERVTLLGLPLVEDRRVLLDRIDAPRARRLFIERALVAGEWDDPPEWLVANQALVADIEAFEDRIRQPGTLVDPERLLELYLERLPDHVTGGARCRRWQRRHSEAAERLRFELEDLVPGGLPDPAGFPDRWDELDLAISYRFDPGSPDDGATLEVPVALLNRLDADRLSWHVPGLRAELIAELLRGLPKRARRALVPLPDRAREWAERLVPGGRSLRDALAAEIADEVGLEVSSTAWSTAELAPHLRLHLRVLDAEGRVLAVGDDLAVLRERLRERMRGELGAAAGRLEGRTLASGDLDEIPRRIEVSRDGLSLVAYPALVAQADGSVSVQVLDSPSAQAAAMAGAARAMVRAHLRSPRSRLARSLDKNSRLVLAGASEGGNATALLDDCLDATLDALVAQAGGPAWDLAGLDRLVAAVTPRAEREARRTLDRVVTLLALVARIHRRLDQIRGADEQVAEIAAHLRRLTLPGFVSGAGLERLDDLVRYARADERRAERLPAAAARDAERTATIHAVEDLYLAVAESLSAPRPEQRAELAELGWLLEELRVSLHAQELGTRTPVSPTRLRRRLQALAAPVDR